MKVRVDGGVPAWRNCFVCCGGGVHPPDPLLLLLLLLLLLPYGVPIPPGFDDPLHRLRRVRSCYPLAVPFFFCYVLYFPPSFAVDYASFNYMCGCHVVRVHLPQESKTRFTREMHD